MLLRVKLCFVSAIVMSSAMLSAQSTYHLHGEASSTPNSLQLRTTATDAVSTAFQSVNLQSSPVGFYVVKEFDTQAGVPGITGVLPSGSSITFSIWMRSTAALGAIYPRVDLRKNGPADQSVCAQSSFASALTTTVAKYTITCTTSADVSFTPQDRIYLAVDADLETVNSSAPFAGEVDIEGTSGGATDSLFTLPAFNTKPKILGLSPNAVPAGATVFVVGQNFGITKSTSTISIGSTVLTPLAAWSNGLVGFQVPATASTGNITVKVGGVASNAVRLTITPGISTLTPKKGPTGTIVTITGTKFGTAKGSVTFNNVAGAITSWVNTKIVATVPSAAITGPVVVTAGTLASNTVPFNVTSCPGTSISISPTSFNLVVGQGHVLIALNSCGQAVTGAVWSIGPSNTAYVTSDAAPSLIAQNPGSATLTATYQGSTAQATVNVFAGPDLPTGTTVWAAPSTSGFIALGITPGVPTGNNTPSYFSTEFDASGQVLVHGIAVDGTTLWVTPAPTGSRFFLPTDDGGMIASSMYGSTNVMTKIDGSGNQVWSTQFSILQPAGAVAEDGTVFTVGDETLSGLSLLAYDGSTGLLKGRVHVPGNAASLISVMPNGMAYLESVAIASNTPTPVQLWLTALASSGASSQQLLATNPGYTAPGPIVPDGNGGVLVTSGVLIGNSVNATVVVDVGGNGGGTYTTLSDPQQAILGDTGAVYLLGTNPATFAWSILAINATTGASLLAMGLPGAPYRRSGHSPDGRRCRRSRRESNADSAGGAFECERSANL